jgi:hypothetical protein
MEIEPLDDSILDPRADEVAHGRSRRFIAGRDRRCECQDGQETRNHIPYTLGETVLHLSGHAKQQLSVNRRRQRAWGQSDIAVS